MNGSAHFHLEVHMSHITKRAAAFALFLGFLMLAWWSVLLMGGQIPEMEVMPIAASLHIAAEGMTGLALVVSGIALLSEKRWARQAFLVSVGMLFYAVIQASGYFAQESQFLLVILFAAIFLGSLLFLALLIREESSARRSSDLKS
jgi:hypothetical protein